MTEIAKMTDAQRYEKSPTSRWPTRHRGISYRLKCSLDRSYFVSWKNGFVPAGKTEREALAKQAELRRSAARGERVIVPARVALKSVAEEWFSEAERRLRPGTVKNYRSDLDRVILPRFGERGIASIGPQDIVNLIKELEALGKAESTTANALKPLSATFDYAVFKEFIAINPMSQVPRGYKPSSSVTREHREWTTAEVDRLIAEARKLDARKEARHSYALAVEVLLRTGLRLGECLGLRFGDIDFDESVLVIRYSWTKDSKLGPVKTASSNRRVPIPPELLKQLAARSLAMDAEDETFVFAQAKGENPPTQSNFNRRAWKPAVKAADLTDGPRVTPHDARHAFVSQMDDLGINSSDVAMIVGHSSSGITEQVYQHCFNREAREKRVRTAMATAMGAAPSE